MVKMKCPCCGYYTQSSYSENEPSFEICEVCFWQHDSLTNDKPNIVNSANRISLNEAKENYKKIWRMQTKIQKYDQTAVARRTAGKQLTPHECFIAFSHHITRCIINNAVPASKMRSSK